MATTVRKPRTSSAVVRRRLDRYPFAEWLRACAEGTDGQGEAWLRMVRGEDYDCTTVQFRTEMHRLAARETSRREAAGEQLGVIARTAAVKGEPDMLELRFEEVPVAATPGHKDRQRNREETRQAGICRETMPPHTVGLPPTGVDCPCVAQKPPTSGEALAAILPQPALPHLVVDPGASTVTQLVGTEPVLHSTEVPGSARVIVPDEPVPALSSGFAGGMSFDEWLASQDGGDDVG